MACRSACSTVLCDVACRSAFSTVLCVMWPVGVRVALCCVLQCVVCYSVLQCVALCCVLQCVAQPWYCAA